MVLGIVSSKPLKLAKLLAPGPILDNPLAKINFVKPAFLNALDPTNNNYNNNNNNNNNNNKRNVNN
jgi:hypothetical protein